MKKKLITLFVVVLLLTAVPVGAAPLGEDWCFGIVLDEEGNGLMLDMDTWKPVHPYYNYISYRGLVTKPGQFILTKEFLNVYGECEDRIDYYTCFPIATPEKVEEFKLLANKGIYELDGIITEIDRATNQIVFVTVDGNEWSEYGIANLRENQRIHVVFYDNGTPGQHDDEIMQIQYGRE